MQSVQASEHQQTDVELYAAWAGGCRNSGTRLIDRYLPAMTRFFANKVFRACDIEEQVATTFERLALKLGSYRREGPFAAYLYAIARNVMREYIKSRERSSKKLSDSPGGDIEALPGPAGSHSEVLQAASDRRVLLAGLRKLPLELQIVMELKYFEGKTQQQIATLLNCPPGTVASRLRRAHEQLRGSCQRLARRPSLLESTLSDLQDWAHRLSAQL